MWVAGLTGTPEAAARHAAAALVSVGPGRAGWKEDDVAMYVVKHQHHAETCPAGHPQMGPMLLQHVSKPNAEANGVRIEGEAVIDGGHTLYLIVEADDQDTVDRYMAPFGQLGSVEVLPASPCEAVVARAAC